MVALTAGDGPHDEEGLGSRSDGGGERGIGGFVGEIFGTGEEPQERAAFLSDVVADRSAEHRITGLQCVEDRALRRRAGNLELHLAADFREPLQMKRKDDADHRRVCTSTDSTAGRSRTMGAQWSPESAETYTWPPVVPK